MAVLSVFLHHILLHFNVTCRGANGQAKKFWSQTFFKYVQKFSAQSKNYIRIDLNGCFEPKQSFFLKTRVQFNIEMSKKWDFSRKSEYTEHFLSDMIFLEMAFWKMYFWASKGQCSVMTSSKNIQKVYLGPPKGLESLVIKQFCWIRYPLFWTF